MSDKLTERIIKHLARPEYHPLQPRRLARTMQIPDDQYQEFRAALDQLRRAGRVVLGGGSAICLPDMSGPIVGNFRLHPRGFGFVVPDEPRAHGDLFIPAGESLDAITGDRVMARVKRLGRRGGRMLCRGTIVQILQRGRSQFVGTLERTARDWLVRPDGDLLHAPILVDDVRAKNARAGDKVVVQIIDYPSWEQPAQGVIVENLGEAGKPEVETQAIVRYHHLPDKFDDKVINDAQQRIGRFQRQFRDLLASGQCPPGREDLRGRTIITIDPTEARDFDDAIDLEVLDDGFILGVHIADVSYFVAPDTPLDLEARERGNSVYLPRYVIPMLPEVLSNGLCSLQEGQDRLAKSAFIHYGPRGKVLGTRFAETVIRSTKRLTYEQATAVLDGPTEGFDPAVIDLLGQMETLARIIEKRRRRQGMLQLDLPEVDLIFDQDGRLTDAQPADTSYPHTIIEMFMVEANEALARLLDSIPVPFLRRVHPQPDAEALANLARYLRLLGHKVPAQIDRHDLQALLSAVRGRPDSFAVNLAVLRSMERAEYGPQQVGHFALASKYYCHFTSPIRRYPDLTVHRLLEQYLRDQPTKEQQTDLAAAEKLAELGAHCSRTERRAEEAERELKDFRVLELLAGRVGEVYDGVVSGVTNFGIFVQLRRYLVDGLIRLTDLSDDVWQADPARGVVVSRSGRQRLKMGQPLKVIIAAVNPHARRLDLAPAEPLAEKKPSPPAGQAKTRSRSKKKKSARRRRGPQ